MFSLFRKQCSELAGEYSKLLEQSKFADLALPCFRLSGEDSPVNRAQELAKIFSSTLTQNKSEYSLVKEIVANGPYVNFYVDKISFSNLVIRTILRGDLYSTKSNLIKKEKYKSQKIILEHTSMNPSGPVHIGRLRNSVIGDSVKRILEFVGYKVETHYYVNDIGKQIAIISFGVKRGIRPDKDLVNLYADYKSKPDFKTMFQYVASNDFVSRSLKDKDKDKNQNQNQNKANKPEAKSETEIEIEKIIQDCESGGPSLKSMKSISKACLEGQLAVLKRLGIVFDKFDFESDYISPAKKLIKKLGPKLKEENGALGLDLSSYGLRDFSVLARQDGTTVYLARDLAYHMYKAQQGAIINVLGEDHRVEAQELRTILDILGVKNVDIIHYSFVNFKGMRLSTRMGQIAPLDALIDEGIEKARREIKKRGIGDTEQAKHIAIAAVRYHMIRTAPSKGINFIWEDALNFEGDTGPYIQYAHARAQSLLRKSKKRAKIGFAPEHVINEDSIKIVKLLSNFPDIVERAADQKSAHEIAAYLHDLAAHFNTFYHSCRVIGSENESEMLGLVKATANVMKNGLSLLGIKALDKM